MSEEVKPTKEELLAMFDEMIKSYDHIPPGGMLTPVTHYDFTSLMILLYAILKHD